MPLNEMMKTFRDSLPTKGSLGLIINVCHSNMNGIPKYNYTTFYKRVIISVEKFKSDYNKEVPRKLEKQKKQEKRKLRGGAQPKQEAGQELRRAKKKWQEFCGMSVKMWHILLWELSVLVA